MTGSIRGGLALRLAFPLDHDPGFRLLRPLLPAREPALPGAQGDAVKVLGGLDGVAARDVHRVQPRQAGKQRDAGKEQGEQEQGAAEGIDDAREAASHEVADDSARVHGKGRGALVVQGRESAPRAHHQHASGGTNGNETRVDLAGPCLQSAVKQPPGIADHHRAQVSHETEQRQQDIGDPRTGDSALVCDQHDMAGGRPARIGRIVACQRNEQVDRDGRDDEQRTLAGAARQRASQQADQSGFVFDGSTHDSNPVSRYSIYHGNY